MIILNKINRYQLSLNQLIVRLIMKNNMRYCFVPMLIIMLTIACKMSHDNTENVQVTEEVLTSVSALAEVAVIEFSETLQPYNAIIDSIKALKVDMISSEYCLYDLTGDSVPELWIRSGSCEADKVMYVYIIKDDKAELLFKDSGDHSDLFESNGIVTNITCNCGGGFLLTYEYKRGKVVRSTPIEFSMFTEDGTPEALNKSQDKKLKHLWNESGKPLVFTDVE